MYIFSGKKHLIQHPSLLHTALQMTPPAPPQKAYIVYTDKYAAVLKRLKTLPLAR